MNTLAKLIGRTGLLRPDLDYHLLRAAMVIIFAWFGYDKWFASEITALAPLITHGPFIFCTIRFFGIMARPFCLERRNGLSARCCFWAFGTKSWACWVL